MSLEVPLKIFILNNLIRLGGSLIYLLVRDEFVYYISTRVQQGKKVNI
jgi:hypothetical protein